MLDSDEFSLNRLRRIDKIDWFSNENIPCAAVIVPFSQQVTNIWKILKLNRSCRKVMFSQACGHCTWIPYSTSPPWHEICIPCPLLLTSGGHHWRPVQTRSFGALLSHQYWHLERATETHIVGKRSVSVLLGYGLVKVLLHIDVIALCSVTK